MYRSKRATGLKRYLRAELLLPGDIILTRGHGWDSTLIAWSTLGRYSHASIYVDDYCLFQSYDPGVQVTALDLHDVGRSSIDGRRTTLVDVSEHRYLEVRRYPSMNARCQSVDGRLQVREAISAFLIPKNGLEYPPLIALAKASRFPTWIMWPLLWAIGWQMGDADIRLPGMFCSELSCELLAAVEPDTFKTLRASDQMSPNDLARTEVSHLERVDETVVDENFKYEPIEQRDVWMDKRRDLQLTRLTLLDPNSARKFQETMKMIADQARTLEAIRLKAASAAGATSG